MNADNGNTSGYADSAVNADNVDNAKDTNNILIVGVGGQGSLLASRIFGCYYMSRGLDVKVSEVHGMSQRGGSVITYVRSGRRVDSPLVPQGEADLLIGLELLETLRWLDHVKQDGAVVVNTRRILPMPVITGAMRYPLDIEVAIRESGRRVVALDALALAKQAGDIRAVNVALIGAAAKLMETSQADWNEALTACIKPQFLEANLKAFSLGGEGFGRE